jgi:hypothetical protein
LDTLGKKAMYRFCSISCNSGLASSMLSLRHTNLERRERMLSSWSLVRLYSSPCEGKKPRGREGRRKEVRKGGRGEGRIIRKEGRKEGGKEGTEGISGSPYDEPS